MSPDPRLAAVISLLGEIHADLDGTLATTDSQVLNQVQTQTGVLETIQTDQSETLRSDTFTATGNGQTLDLAGYAAKYFTLSVAPTGGVTSWDVRMEVSIDGVAWLEVAQHTNVTPGASIPKPSTTVALARKARARCAGLVLGGGTNVIATIVASR